jgi:hypothetical protein
LSRKKKWKKVVVFLQPFNPFKDISNVINQNLEEEKF